MKVYILVFEGCYEGEETGVELEVYATFERAKNALRQAINVELAEGTHFGEMWNDPEQRKNLVIEESESSWEVYENGWEANNHASCYIVEREVTK